MTVEVAGVWETGWDAPRQEVDRWKFMLKEFGVDKLHMSPVSGIFADTTQTLLIEHRNLETLIPDARAAGKVIVFVDEAATVELPAFKHPVDVLYVTGKTSFSPYVSFFDAEAGDLSVKIPTVRNAGGFWSNQAMALVLYDRMLKKAV